VKVLATYNIKGGVGKTSTAVNLAFLAAREDRRTLLWDLDPQAAATFLFRVRPRVKGGGHALVTRKRPIEAALKATDFDNLDLLPADFSYRNMDLELRDTKRPAKGLERVLDRLAEEEDYDYVFLDCPPAISLASESIFRAADVLLVPLIPTPLSLRTFEQLRAFMATDVAKAPAILAFFSMADGHRPLHAEVIAEMSAAHRGVLGAVIPAATDVERMAVQRRALAQFAPRGRAGRAYEALWDELRARLE